MNRRAAGVRWVDKEEERRGIVLLDGGVAYLRYS